MESLLNINKKKILITLLIYGILFVIINIINVKSGYMIWYPRTYCKARYEAVGEPCPFPEGHLAEIPSIIFVTIIPLLFIYVSVSYFDNKNSPSKSIAVKSLAFSAVWLAILFILPIIFYIISFFLYFS